MAIETRLGKVIGPDGTSYNLQVKGSQRINPEAYPLLREAMEAYLTRAEQELLASNLTQKTLVIKQSGIQGTSYNDPQSWLQLAKITAKLSEPPEKLLKNSPVDIDDYHDLHIDATYRRDPLQPSSLSPPSFRSDLPTQDELALEFAQKLVAPEKFSYKKHERLYRGVLLSMLPREDLTAEIDWQGVTCTNRIEFVRSNPLNGCVYQKEGKAIRVENALIPAKINKTSNFKETIPLQRKVITSVGNEERISSYAGRVVNKEQAEEMAKFLFLSEFTAQKPRGITLLSSGEYTFQFAVQSILSFSAGKELAMLKQEVLAYESLQGKRLTVTDPQTGDEITFTVTPPLIANTQMNIWQTLSHILPDFITKLDFERELSFKNDQKLFALLKEKNGKIPKTTWLAALTSFQLLFKEGIPELGPAVAVEPWKQILARAYLYRLLDIPLIVHCKSSTDRTGAISAMLSAMDQTLMAKYPSSPPQDILSLTKEASFKSLYMANLLQGLQVAIYSRGKNRFKIFTQVKIPKTKKWATLYELPVVQDLVPDDYLKDFTPPKMRTPVNKKGYSLLSPSTA